MASWSSRPAVPSAAAGWSGPGSKPETLTQVPGHGPIRHWVQLTDVALPLVSFEAVRVFEDQTSTSTLRFRTQDEITASLIASGYDVREIRDAADRPGRELVFFAEQAGG